MQYNLRLRTNPMDSEDSRYYAEAVKVDELSFDEVTNEIATFSSLGVGEVKSVLDYLYTILPKYLMKGFTVPIGTLGKLRVTLKSAPGAKTVDEFNTNLITPHIVYTPSKTMKNSLQDITYTRNTVIGASSSEADATA